ncbi:MAG: hypothetical protein UMU75_05240 [Halomonas sp.]|nr:hypothetical protein [Halomonas sp.]
MATRSFKIAPATGRPGHSLSQPDYWILLETTGGRLKELRRYPTYPEALRASREVGRQPTQ